MVLLLAAEVVIGDLINFCQINNVCVPNEEEIDTLDAGWNIGLTEFRRLRKRDGCGRKNKTKTFDS